MARRLSPHLLLLFLALVLAPATAEAVDPEVKDLIRTIEQNAKEPFEQRKRETAIRKLGKIGGTDAARALLPLFDDPFVHIPDHAVSAWITMLRGKRAADTQTFLTNRGLNDRNPAVRRGVAVALGMTSGKEIEGPLRVALGKEKDPLALAALADAAARLREKPDLKGVLLERLGAKDGRAALHLALAAAALDGKDAVKPLQRLLKHRAGLARAGAVYALQTLDALPPGAVDRVLGDKDPAPAMALAESLELRTEVLPWPGRGQSVLAALLAHSNWRVRAAAVQGALRIWDPGIVELLIARLGDERGRIQDDVRRALETYTGQTTQGVDAELWTAWWRQRRAEFDASERPKKDKAGNIPFGEASGTAKADGSKTVAFFDLPLQSKRFAFVFDLSGSMKSVAKKGATEGRTKLQVLQAEMEKTLAALPEDTLFDLYVYRYWSSYPPKTKLTRALGKMQPCTKANVRKALAWLGKQEAKGWGAFYEPLELLLEQDVDSVVLLSDGSPSRGRYDRDFRILQEFPRANRFRRMAVNTVLVGTKGADRKFMQALAEATGGRFRSAGDE
jgi:HEAT repeat protein